MSTIAQLAAAAAALDNDVLPTQQNADGVTRKFLMSQIFNYVASKLFPTSPVGSVAVGTGAVGGIQFVTPNTAGNPVAQDALGNISTQTVKPTGGTAARSLSALFGDFGQNLYSLGGATQAGIDAAYAAAGNGSTIDVPYGATWNGALTSPNPAKAVTWNFLGQPNLGYAIAAGDGDLTISTANASAQYSKNFLNATAFAPVINILMENFDPNFPSVFAGNFAQNAAINCVAYSGPTASGNTGNINLLMNSYGMSPSASFDIPLTIVPTKYGQTSNWGMVINMVDQTGRLPQAFSAWNEFDCSGSGHDLSPMDPTYYSGAAANRVHLFSALSAFPFSGWVAGHAYVQKSTAQNSITAASVISVSASSVLYNWYCIQSGTSGTTQPTWPSPKVGTGSISTSGVFTVTALQSGSANFAVNDYLTAAGVINPIKITSYITGTGGAGSTMQTNYNGAALSAAGYYGAPQITDNGVIWQFGTEYYNQMSAAICITQADQSRHLVGVAIRTTIVLAGVDVSGSTLTGSYAAAYRMAPNQSIDFSGGGTQATLNLRTLGYATGAASLNYNANGSNKMLISDAAAITLNPSTNLIVNGGFVVGNSNSNLNGVTTGYAYPGLTVGVSQLNGLEVDFIGGPGGFVFFSSNTSGTITTPLFQVSTGLVKIASGTPLQIGSAYTSGAPTVTGYINITDSGGTVRKVACA